MSKLRPTPAFVKRLEFLSSGRLYLKDAVKSITFSYTIRGEGSSGIRRFIAEKLPPIQFKNPDVQMVTFKSAAPTPLKLAYYNRTTVLFSPLDQYLHTYCLTSNMRSQVMLAWFLAP